MRTLYVLRHRRAAMMKLWNDPKLTMGRLANLPQEDYDKVVENFQRAYDALRFSTISYICVRPWEVANSPFGSVSNETQLYTMMNRFTYNASSEMYVRQELLTRPVNNSVEDIVHELGRRDGKQYEQDTGSAIWDVYLWDKYINMINQSYGDLTKLGG